MSAKWFAPALVLAALSGWACAALFPDAAWLATLTDAMRDAFLAALKLIIAPLIFFSLISGILQLRNSRAYGRLGSITLTYYLVTSAIAIGIGLIVVFFIHPWTDYPPLQTMPDVDFTLIDTQAAATSDLLAGLLQSILTNPFTALAELNILGILANALLFGLAAAYTLPAESRIPGAIDEITQVIYKVAGWVLLTLPLGLFAITHQLADKIDYATLLSLGHFALVVFGATMLHGLVILPGIAWLACGITPWRFFRQAYEPILTAFLTSSSAATLPLSLATAREKLGVQSATASFVLPLGATINMDGTALFEGVAVIFLAYMFGIALDGPAIVVVFLVTMLAAAGAPGIPSGSMAGLQTVLLAVGIPLEAIGLILLIERPLDTFRTAVNVEGDLIGSLIAEKYAVAVKTRTNQS